MSETGTVVVADTSVVINLNASGCAGDILAALPFRLVITDIVASEVQEDRRSGRPDAALLKALTDPKRVGIVSLDGTGLEIFADLVIGSAVETIDDGEAATIAYAAVAGLAPVLDERKALRIYAARFQGPPALTTVDLFAAAPVEVALGRAILRDAVFQAL
jgi:predicted nucleic acid-binding protein